MLRLTGMFGLGDNLYQRAVVRELGPVSLVTPWPQLYADLPVSCVRPVTRLRTQARNAARRDLAFAPNTGNHARRIGYDAQGTMLASMLRSVGLQREAITFDGPPVQTSGQRDYILIRPATVRTEWRADARNPLPEYLCRAAEALRDRYTLISVADLAPGAEWAVEPMPFAHERYHAGEMALEQLLALVAGAAGVVGGVGWLVPAAVAYRVPMLLVYGGWGASNGPQRIFDPRMPTQHIVQAMPDEFCLCNDRFHNCNRTIRDFDERLDEFALAADRHALRQAPALAA